MSDHAAVALLGAAAGTALVTAFVLRPRIPPSAWIFVLAVCGILAGTAALSLEHGPVPLADWVLTLSLLAVATPLHVFVVFGKPRAGAVR